MLKHGLIITNFVVLAQASRGTTAGSVRAFAEALLTPCDHALPPLVAPCNPTWAFVAYFNILTPSACGSPLSLVPGIKMNIGHGDGFRVTLHSCSATGIICILVNERKPTRLLTRLSPQIKGQRFLTAPRGHAGRPTARARARRRQRRSRI